jgi:hypothetical protein
MLGAQRDVGGEAAGRQDHGPPGLDVDLLAAEFRLDPEDLARQRLLRTMPVRGRYHDGDLPLVDLGFSPGRSTLRDLVVRGRGCGIERADDRVDLGLEFHAIFTSHWSPSRRAPP